MRALWGKLLGAGGLWSSGYVTLSPEDAGKGEPRALEVQEKVRVPRFSHQLELSHFWGHVEIGVTLEAGLARVGLSQLTNLASPPLAIQWALDPPPPQVLERAPGSWPQAWWLEGCELLANVFQAPSPSPHPSVNSHKNSKG